MPKQKKKESKDPNYISIEDANLDDETKQLFQEEFELIENYGFQEMLINIYSMKKRFQTKFNQDFSEMTNKFEQIKQKN